MRTSYRQKDQEIGKQRKTVTFDNPDQKWGEVEEEPEQESFSGEKDVKESCPVNEQNPEQESLSGESDVEENYRAQEQDREDKLLSGEFRRMSRAYKTEPAKKMCSSDDNNSTNSEIDTYSYRFSSLDQNCQS